MEGTLVNVFIGFYFAEFGCEVCEHAASCVIVFSSMSAICSKILLACNNGVICCVCPLCLINSMVSLHRFAMFVKLSAAFLISTMLVTSYASCRNFLYRLRKRLPPVPPFSIMSAKVTSCWVSFPAVLNHLGNSLLVFLIPLCELLVIGGFKYECALWLMDCKITLGRCGRGLCCSIV